MEIPLIAALVVSCVVTFFALVYGTVANERAVKAKDDCLQANGTIEAYREDYRKLHGELIKWQKRHRKIVKQLGYDPDAMNLSE